MGYGEGVEPLKPPLSTSMDDIVANTFCIHKLFGWSGIHHFIRKILNSFIEKKTETVKQLNILSIFVPSKTKKCVLEFPIIDFLNCLILLIAIIHSNTVLYRISNVHKKLQISFEICEIFHIAQTQITMQLM